MEQHGDTSLKMAITIFAGIVSWMHQWNVDEIIRIIAGLVSIVAGAMVIAEKYKTLKSKK